MEKNCEDNITIKKEEGRLKKWLTTKAWPWVENAGRSLINVLGRGLRRVGQLRLSWLAILALVILFKLCEAEQLSGIPNLEWFIESSMRLVDWLFGLLKGIIEWAVNHAELEPFKEWARFIFGM